jgi:hypothetical protein
MNFALHIGYIQKWFSKRVIARFQMLWPHVYVNVQDRSEYRSSSNKAILVSTVTKSFRSISFINRTKECNSSIREFERLRGILHT